MDDGLIFPYRVRATSDESYGTNRPLVSINLFGWWFQVRGIFVGSSQVMG